MAMYTNSQATLNACVGLMSRIEKVGLCYVWYKGTKGIEAMKAKSLASKALFWPRTKKPSLSNYIQSNQSYSHFSQEKITLPPLFHALQQKL